MIDALELLRRYSDRDGRLKYYEPAWAARLGAADRRALSPLFWTNINPYGEIHLDMTRRLGLTPSPAS